MHRLLLNASRLLHLLCRGLHVLAAGCWLPGASSTSLSSTALISMPTFPSGASRADTTVILVFRLQERTQASLENRSTIFRAQRGCSHALRTTSVSVSVYRDFNLNLDREIRSFTISTFTLFSSIVTLRDRWFFFVRGLSPRLSPDLISAFTPILHGSEGDFLSCFIDSNFVCQRFFRA